MRLLLLITCVWCHQKSPEHNAKCRGRFAAVASLTQLAILHLKMFMTNQEQIDDRTMKIEVRASLIVDYGCPVPSDSLRDILFATALPFEPISKIRLQCRVILDMGARLQGNGGDDGSSITCRVLVQRSDVKGSGYIQFAPQKPFSENIVAQPPTVSVRACIWVPAMRCQCQLHQSLKDHRHLKTLALALRTVCMYVLLCSMLGPGIFVGW